ncbi:MAG: hypothetical protein NTZ00_02345 [Bacteroidetes bacterium]|nr:hypothetical protein [Bacteroidota bacterium]
MFNIFGFSISGCKKKCLDKLNPDCENYDPCYGKSETKAAFKIEQYLGPWEGEAVWIEADTVSATGNSFPVKFTATCEADSFIWEIGASKYYEKSFALDFFPSDAHIPVTLIVINKNPKKACFPKDNGRDTLTRIMYTWKEEKYWDGTKYIFHPHPIKGTYDGYFKSKPEVKTIIRFYDTSLYCESHTPKINPFTFLDNIPPGYYSIDSCGFLDGSSGVPFASYIGGNMVQGKNNKDISQILRIRGVARLIEDRKTINIKFTGFKLFEPKITINDEFNGIKIK